MRTKDTLDARPLIFLAVLMLHAAIVLLLVRPVRLLTHSGTSDEPLLLMLLRSIPPPATGAASPRPAPAANARSAKREPAPVPDNAITLPPEAPPEGPPRPSIDWQHEAELAAQNAIAGAEREGNFRDLSSLTPSQLRSGTMRAHELQAHLSRGEFCGRREACRFDVLPSCVAA